jgi:membrane protease YdiL (CAAX protease family)
LIPDAFGRYFRVGDLAAPAGPVRVLGIRAGDTWRQIGARFMVIIATVTAAVILLPAVAGDGFSLGLPYVALALCLAASNAFVEEYLTRFQIVASLRGTMSPGRIAIVSGALFGSAHYLGTPGGPVGVVLAGFLGWLLAKSVLETRGIGWAWFIHFVLDVIIFVAILGSL